MQRHLLRSYLSDQSGLQTAVHCIDVGFREADQLLISRARPIVKDKDGIYCS